jgi:PKD domain
MTALVVACVPGPAVGKTLPVDFGWQPAAPTAGGTTTLTVTSNAADVVAALWDFDGDDVFDAMGTTVATTFAAPGPHPVRVVVFGAGGDSGSAVHTVAVGPPPPPPPPPPAATIAAAPPAPVLPMVPFPIVRMQGLLVRGGVKVRRLSVHAPAGAHVHVACATRGHGCPRLPTDAISRSAARGMRVRRFERRLRAGAIVQVWVTDGHSIGKYTSFRIRRHGAPFRRDLCVAPGASVPSRCPGS